jgi:hypothetical protein
VINIWGRREYIETITHYKSEILRRCTVAKERQDKHNLLTKKADSDILAILINPNSFHPRLGQIYIVLVHF